MRPSAIACEMLLMACLDFSWNILEAPAAGTPPATGGGLTQSRDFGVVDEGTTAVAVFKIENISPSEIVFKDVRLSCGCLSVRAQPRSIAPNAIGAVRLALDTRAHHGREDQTAVFEVDHPKYKYVRLRMSGVVRGAWAHPGAVDLGAISPGARAIRSFFVLEAGLAGARLEAVRVDHPAIEVARESVVTDEQTKRQGVRALSKIVVRWSGQDAPPGPFHASISISVGAGAGASIGLVVPVSAHVMGSADVRPAPLLFGRIAPGVRVARLCRVQLGPRCGARDLRMVQLALDGCEGDCIIERVDDDDPLKGTLRVSLKPSASRGGGLIEGAVTGANGGKPLFSVPFVAFLAADDAPSPGEAGSRNP